MGKQKLGNPAKEGEPNRYGVVALLYYATYMYLHWYGLVQFHLSSIESKASAYHAKSVIDKAP